MKVTVRSKVLGTCIGAPNDFKKGYRPRTNIVKVDKGDLVQTITAFWLGGGTISPRFNLHGVNDVRQTEIQTAEPLVPEPSASDVELAVEKLKSHKSPGIDQIPAALIKAGGKTICCEIPKIIVPIWNKEVEGVGHCTYL